MLDTFPFILSPRLAVTIRSLTSMLLPTLSWAPAYGAGQHRRMHRRTEDRNTLLPAGDQGHPHHYPADDDHRSRATTPHGHREPYYLTPAGWTRYPHGSDYGRFRRDPQRSPEGWNLHRDSGTTPGPTRTRTVTREEVTVTPLRRRRPPPPLPREDKERYILLLLSLFLIRQSDETDIPGPRAGSVCHPTLWTVGESSW